MAVQPIVWPRCVLPFRGLSPNFRSRSRSGGTSLAGTEAVVTTGAGIWMATGAVVVRGRQAILSFRGLAARLRGRAMPAMVPFCDLRPAFPTVAGALVTRYDPVPHSDDTTFSDGSAYVQDAIVATVAETTDEGSHSIALSIVSAGDLYPGHHFSIAGRLYRIREGYAPAGSTAATFIIDPALRRLAPAGAHVEFDRPECLMRLASDEALDLDLDLGRFADPSVSFVEFF